MQTFLSAAKQFATDEEGVTAIEYGLIAALIAAVVAGSFTTIGTTMKTMLDTLAGKL